MKYIFLSDPKGEYQDKDKVSFRVQSFSDIVNLVTPFTVYTAASEADAATQAGLTFVISPVDQAALTKAKAKKMAALGEKLRTDLLAIFANWTVGEQYDFDGARVALNADLLAGNIVRAITGVSTFRVADATLTDHRNAVLGVLNAAAAKFGAVQAASTVEAVNAIS